MPYEVVKVRGGYKVQKKGGKITSTGRRYFSNGPLPKERACDQMRALYASERQRSPERTIKSPTRRRYRSPVRSVKSPSRKRKPTSPKRVRKRHTSPKPKKRQSSPKIKRK